MNARTNISANGDVPLPADVLFRLRWAPGTTLEMIETADGVSLRAQRPGGRKTLADIDALPIHEGSAQPVEAISSLSDDDLRRLT